MMYENSKKKSSFEVMDINIKSRSEYFLDGIL